jgi:hypothetical protein
VAREGLTLNREVGNRGACVEDLECLAWVVRARGNPARCARLLGAAIALRDRVGTPIPPIRRSEHEREVEAVRTLLGEEAFAAALAEGRAMTFEQGIAYALEGSAPT